jgi:hypothetical protein
MSKYLLNHSDFSVYCMGNYLKWYVRKLFLLPCNHQIKNLGSYYLKSKVTAIYWIVNECNFQFSMDHHKNMTGNCVHNSPFSYHKIPYKTHAFNVLSECWTIFFWREVLSVYFLAENHEGLANTATVQDKMSCYLLPKHINLNTANLRRDFSCNYICYSFHLVFTCVQTLLRYILLSFWSRVQPLYKWNYLFGFCMEHFLYLHLLSSI